MACFSGGGPKDGGGEGVQVALVGVGEGLVEVLQHGGAAGTLLHGLVTGPDGGGHPALAHVAAHDGGALRQVPTDCGQNVVEVRRGSAEAGGAEEEDLLPGDLTQEVGHRGVAVTLGRAAWMARASCLVFPVLLL